MAHSDRSPLTPRTPDHGHRLCARPGDGGRGDGGAARSAKLFGGARAPADPRAEGPPPAPAGWATLRVPADRVSRTELGGRRYETSSRRSSTARPRRPPQRSSTRASCRTRSSTGWRMQSRRHDGRTADAATLRAVDRHPGSGVARSASAARRASAATRHLVWHAAILAVLAAPLLAPLTPSVPVPVLHEIVNRPAARCRRASRGAPDHVIGLRGLTIQASSSCRARQSDDRVAACRRPCASPLMFGRLGSAALLVWFAAGWVLSAARRSAARARAPLPWLSELNDLRARLHVRSEVGLRVVDRHEQPGRRGSASCRRFCCRRPPSNGATTDAVPSFSTSWRTSNAAIVGCRHSRKPLARCTGSTLSPGKRWPLFEWSANGPAMTK